MKLTKITVLIMSFSWLFNTRLLADNASNASMVPVVANVSKGAVDEAPVYEDYLQENEQLVAVEESVELFGDDPVVEELPDGLIDDAEEIDVRADVEEALDEDFREKESFQEDEEEIVTTNVLPEEGEESSDNSVSSLIDETADDIALHEKSIFNDEYEGDKPDSEDEEEDWTKVGVVDDVELNQVLSEADYSEDEARADDAFKLEQQFIVASETTLKKTWSEKFLDWFRPLIAS